jgi:hypothetical protein
MSETSPFLTWSKDAKRTSDTVTDTAHHCSGQNSTASVSESRQLDVVLVIDFTPLLSNRRRNEDGHLIFFQTPYIEKKIEGLQGLILLLLRRNVLPRKVLLEDRMEVCFPYQHRYHHSEVSELEVSLSNGKFVLCVLFTPNPDFFDFS